MPLLLKLDEIERALQRAEASSDPDLVFLTLFHLFKNPANIQDAVKALRGRPAVQRLFLNYCATAVSLATTFYAMAQQALPYMCGVSLPKQEGF